MIIARQNYLKQKVEDLQDFKTKVAYFQDLNPKS